MDMTKTSIATFKDQSKKWDILWFPILFYLSVIAIERIDFLQGQGSFKLTLELLGALLFLACFAVDTVLRKGIIVFSTGLAQYSKLLLIFLLTIFLSVPFSADFEMSVRRSILLSVYMLSGLLAVNYIVTRHREKFTSMVIACMVFQTSVYLFFCVYDIALWFDSTFAEAINNFFPFIDRNLSSMGNEYLRVRAANGDPNRAGIFLIVDTYLILRYCKNPVVRMVMAAINCVITILTRSRTAVLCMVLFFVLYFFNYRKLTGKKIFNTVIAITAICGIAIGLYQVPSIRDAVGQTFIRFQTRDASANTHIDLIRFGLDTALSDPKVLLVGNGYGASRTILEALLGNTKYANFHNAFVSFLVECGFISSVLFILLLLFPLKKDKSLFPIIAVLILANIPYQIYIEPYFWFLLPFLCVSSLENMDKVSLKKLGSESEICGQASLQLR